MRFPLSGIGRFSKRTCYGKYSRLYVIFTSLFLLYKTRSYGASSPITTVFFVRVHVLELATFYRKAALAVAVLQFEVFDFPLRVLLYVYSLFL